MTTTNTVKKKIHSVEELNIFAQEFSAQLKSGDVVGLVGDLGAGKTTFVQYLAKALGVHHRVNSPTFLVMRLYDCRLQKKSSSNNRRSIVTLVHIDAYRLKAPQELEALGAMDYIGAPHTITVIEWADRVRAILPQNTQWITFEHGKSESQRLISYQQ